MKNPHPSYFSIGLALVIGVNSDVNWLEMERVVCEKVEFRCIGFANERRI